MGKNYLVELYHLNYHCHSLGKEPTPGLLTHQHVTNSINDESSRYLVVLVGEVQPLVEGDGTVTVVVNSLEHVRRASLGGKVIITR